MDNEYRLTIKRGILSKAQYEGSEIPYLGYHSIEIISPVFVDGKLIRLIDDGEPLTDKLFFECLEESPDYLAYEPFRMKIKEWQEEAEDLEKPEDERRQAKTNLSRISKALLPYQNERGRPEKWKDRKLAWNQEVLFWSNEIEAFFEEVKDLPKLKQIKCFQEKYSGLFWGDEIEGLQEDVKDLPDHKKIEYFQEKRPDLDEKRKKKCAAILRKHRTSHEIAKAIIVETYDISKRTLYSELEATRKVTEKTRALYSSPELSKE